MAKDRNTETQILEAAEKVFQVKGYSGARMREIADQAGINKGLLHYYFKSKDKLFEAIFTIAFRQMIKKLESIILKDTPLDVKINTMVDHYMGFMIKNPGLPNFVISELNKDPEKFISRHVGNNKKNVFKNFEASIKKEIDADNIKNIDARQLLMNITSMIIYPFLGRPMFQILFGHDHTEFKKLLEERKSHIKQFVKDALMK